MQKVCSLIWACLGTIAGQFKSAEAPALGNFALDTRRLSAIPRTSQAHALHLPATPLLSLVERHAMLLARVLDVFAPVRSQASIFFDFS